MSALLAGVDWTVWQRARMLPVGVLVGVLIGAAAAYLLEKDDDKWG